MATFRWECGVSRTVIIPERQGSRVPVRQVTETSSAVMPARTSSAVATLALLCFPGCRYHAFSGNESTRSESSENTHAYFHLTSKETVRKAYKSRCAPRPSCPAFPSPRPSPPSPPPEGLEDRLAFNSGCYKTPKASLSHGNSA